jgi:hypothetical protein
MNNGDKRWFLQWRRYSVDVLITAATLAVGAAALGTTADVFYLLLIFGAILGLALLLEPEVHAQIDMDAHPMKLAAERALLGPPPRSFDSAHPDARSMS